MAPPPAASEGLHFIGGSGEGGTGHPGAAASPLGECVFLWTCPLGSVLFAVPGTVDIYLSASACGAWPGGRRVQCASTSAQDCSSGTACCRPVSALELLVVQVMFGLHQPSTVFSLVLYGLNLLHVELCKVPSFFSFIARDIFLFNLVVVYKHYSYKS